MSQQFVGNHVAQLVRVLFYFFQQRPGCPSHSWSYLFPPLAPNGSESSSILAAAS